jgi:uncharacterized protein YyaL (SSP411 family)
MLVALDLYLAHAQEVVIVGGSGAPDTQALLAVLRRRFLPNAVWALRESSLSESDAAAITPLLARREAVGGRATAYVCEHFACRRPVTDPASFAAELQ